MALLTGLSIAADMMEQVDWTAQSADEVEAWYEDTDPVDLELAEVLSGVLAASEIPLPAGDALAAARLARYGVRASGPGRGIVGVLADGRLGLCVRSYPVLSVIESDGSDVALIREADPARYVEWWRVPAVLYPEAWQ